VLNAWEFPLYGGTVLLAARRGGEPTAVLEKIVEAELAAVVHAATAVQKLQRVDGSIAALRRLTEDAVASGASIYRYSAASRAVALIYLAGIGADLLRGVADASPARQGCRMPGTAIPVLSAADLVAARPGMVLLFVSDPMTKVRRALRRGPPRRACAPTARRPAAAAVLGL
jgi:C-methyltransferase C-terminal domain